MRRWMPILGVLSVMLLLSIGPVHSVAGSDVLQTTVHGFVFETHSRNPQGDALVLVSKLDGTGSFSTRTDGRGFYRFGSEVLDGCWMVQAFTEQGSSQSETVHCNGAAPIEVATLWIQSWSLPHSRGAQ